MARLFAVLSVENQQRTHDEPQVLAWHCTLSRWIRNTFDLWQGNRALLASCIDWRHGGRHSSADNADTSRPGPHFYTGDASTVILEAPWQR